MVRKDIIFGGETPIYFVRKEKTKLHRYFHGKKLDQVCCDIYRPNYYYACHSII